jgi:hypothetical protein
LGFLIYPGHLKMVQPTPTTREAWTLRMTIISCLRKRDRSF